MRVLYFTQYYPPEVGATQTRAKEMASYLASRGHSVTVITEVPNHPSGIVAEAYRGALSRRNTEAGVTVLRLWVAATPDKTFAGRMRFYLSYSAISTVAGLLLRGRYDVAFATSPPLFVGPAAMLVSLVRRIPFVFEVRDLWPESAVALGELQGKKAIRAAEMLERLLYRSASAVVGVTAGIIERLKARGVPAAKLRLITNGANAEHFCFSADGRKRVRKLLGVETSFVAIYAGVHGIAQGLETILAAADRLRDCPEIVFLFVGEGPRKQSLMEEARALRLKNVIFSPEVSAADMPAFLSAADCAIVPLKNLLLFAGALPSKMFEAWSVERPVVLSVAGEAATVLSEAAGGFATTPESALEMADAILKLKEDPGSAQKMGRAGRLYVEENYSRSVQARRLELLLSEVVRVARPK